MIRSPDPCCSAASSKPRTPVESMNVRPRRSSSTSPSRLRQRLLEPCGGCRGPARRGASGGTRRCSSRAAVRSKSRSATREPIVWCALVSDARDRQQHLPCCPAGFELPLEPRLPAHRRDRPGRARGARRRAGQAVDQEGVQALRARARRADDGPHDARGLRHARQGRRAGGQGDPARSRRPVRAELRGGLRLSQPRPDRGRARARDRRQGGVGRDRVPVRPVAARDQARRGRGGRRARRRRDRHGDRPRRLPLRPLREGLRRDRARQGGVRRTRT